MCVGVFESVATLVSAMSPLKVKARYQQKALDAGNKMNVGIELKVLSLIPRPSTPPVFDRLQYAKTEGEGLGNFIT